jgi:hypothetical protein
MSSTAARSIKSLGSGAAWWPHAAIEVAISALKLKLSKADHWLANPASDNTKSAVAIQAALAP